MTLRTHLLSSASQYAYGKEIIMPSRARNIEVMRTELPKQRDFSRLPAPLTFAVYIGAECQRDTISAYTRKSAGLQAKQRYGSHATVRPE